MKTVTDAGLAAGTPTIFATNVLQIATAPGNPKGIAAFADLAKPDLKVVVCAPQVPCGAAAEKIEKATGVTLTPVSEEADVKSTLGKVTSGDADAGLVYVTDVSAAKGSVQGVSFPEANQATTNYPITVLKNAPQARAGAAVRRPGDRDRTGSGCSGQPGSARKHVTDVPAQVRGAGSTAEPSRARRRAAPPAVDPRDAARSRWSRCPSSGSCCGPTGARMPELLTSEAALDALRLSLMTAAISTALCIVLGGPLAVVLARGRLPGLRVLRSVVLLPLVLPPVVGGLALLFLLGRTGLLGRQLDLWFGVTIPFTTTAVVLAQTFVALPFLVVSLEGALRTAGGRYEAVAATLGAGPGYAFRRVTVPLVLPGLASGSVLAFARCLGEFGATTAFAGSLQGTTRTLPLLVYLERETDVAGAVALSLLLVAVAVVVIAVGARASRPKGCRDRRGRWPGRSGSGTRRGCRRPPSRLHARRRDHRRPG